MYKRHFRFKDGKITGASKIVLDQPVIPVTTYRQFKKFVEKISQYEKEKIVFEAVGAQAPPKPKSANPSPESSTSKVSKAD